MSLSKSMFHEKKQLSVFHCEDNAIVAKLVKHVLLHTYSSLPCKTLLFTQAIDEHNEIGSYTITPNNIGKADDKKNDSIKKTKAKKNNGKVEAQTTIENDDKRFKFAERGLFDIQQGHFSYDLVITDDDMGIEHLRGLFFAKLITSTKDELKKELERKNDKPILSPAVIGLLEKKDLDYSKILRNLIDLDLVGSKKLHVIINSDRAKFTTDDLLNIFGCSESINANQLLTDIANLQTQLTKKEITQDEYDQALYDLEKPLLADISQRRGIVFLDKGNKKNSLNPKTLGEKLQEINKAKNRPILDNSIILDPPAASAKTSPNRLFSPPSSSPQSPTKRKRSEEANSFSKKGLVRSKTLILQ